MVHNVAEYGLLTIGSIVNISVSFSRFGAIVTIVGVINSALISFCICTLKSKNANLIGTWFWWLSNLCNVCVCAAGLSHFIDYFDGNESQDYIHFVPTRTMPHLMPITVIVVISLLFALGLEESPLLNSLLSASFLLTFVIFLMTGFGNVQYHFKFPEFQEDFMSLVIPSTLLILPCYLMNGYTNAEPIRAVIITGALYLVIVIILAGLTTVKCKLYGLLCPLNKFHLWYEPTEVTFISCTLALASYRLYIPALKTLLLFGGQYYNFICKENKVTSTHLNAVFIIGSICSFLIYLYSSYQLLMIGSSAFVIGHTLNIVLPLNNNYQPEFMPKIKENMIPTSNHYEQINNAEISPVNDKRTINQGKNDDNDDDDDDEGAFSDDSGHSSETDIDAEVADYKEKIKILMPFKQDTPVPTLQTGCLVTVLLIFIALLSLLVSQALQNNQVITSALLVLGIICWSFIILHQPSRDQTKQEYNGRKFLLSISAIVANIILLGSVNSQIWLILLIWIIFGILLWTQNKYGKVLLQKSRKKIQYLFKADPPPLISTECYMVQTSAPIQLQENSSNPY